ncbi:uncharacterized protein LOC144503427 [Mustelus asterias]
MVDQFEPATVTQRINDGDCFKQKGEPVIIAPGYELSRTKSNIAVCLYISLESRFQNECKEASLKMQREHEKELRKLAEVHALEIEELQNNFADLLEEEKEKARKKYSDMKAQYENLQAAFVSFKESFIDEMNARWAQKETELIEKHENEKRRELSLQKNSIQRKCDVDRQLMSDDYEEQIILILDKHNKEMEAAAKQYSSIMEMIMEVKKAKEEIKILQEQLDQKVEELKNQTQYIDFLETQLAADRAKLAEIEGTYKTNIGVMERQYVVSIKALEDQNLDLKQLFAIKAEELCALKAAIEERQRQDDIVRRMSRQEEFGQAYEAITPPLSEKEQGETPVTSQTDVESPEG